MMIDSVRIIWKSILEGIAQARKQRSEQPDQPCPTCKECGCATVRAKRDHVYEVGSNGDTRTEPLVKATLIYNTSVFQCVNPKCGLYYIGNEGSKEFANLEKALKKELKIRKRI
jgi:hypothetical protein